MKYYLKLTVTDGAALATIIFAFIGFCFWLKSAITFIKGFIE